MAAQVVDLVELLCATTEAGLGPSEALRRSTGALSGPLGAELHAVVGRIELGQPWRAAFEELVGRVEIPSLRRLSIALARSHRLGTSLRVSLRTVAQDLRDERRLRAEETARRAPVKMLFPLVLLILPAFLLLTVGPVLLATIRSLDSG
jgi:tight adherence protein C